MKKIIDDSRLIYKCCSLYYEDNMGQQEISDYLGISRATVSRMLNIGREQGIVKIQVVNPVQFSYGKLEKALERKYGLKEVIVVEKTSLDTREDSFSKLSEKAALFLSQFFQDGDYIGVSMGYTLHKVINVKRAFPKEKNYRFVPIIGGISQGNVAKIDVQSNQIVKEFAKKFGGTYSQFYAPAVFSTKEARDSFLKEPSIRSIFDEFQKLNTLVMGIGYTERVGGTLISAGYVTQEELDGYAFDGAVGDVSLRFYDKDGNGEAYSEFNDRVAGMPVSMLKQVKNRIGIGEGKERSSAIEGAIKGGFINILITDIDCAEALL